MVYDDILIIKKKKQLRDILQNTWPVTLNNVKGIKNKASSRNYHSQEEPKKTWLLNKWSRDFSDLKKKNPLGKAKKSWIKF